MGARIPRMKAVPSRAGGTIEAVASYPEHGESARYTVAMIVRGADEARLFMYYRDDVRGRVPAAADGGGRGRSVVQLSRPAAHPMHPGKLRPVLNHPTVEQVLERLRPVEHLDPFCSLPMVHAPRMQVLPGRRQIHDHGRRGVLVAPQRRKGFLDARRGCSLWLVDDREERAGDDA